MGSFPCRARSVLTLDQPKPLGVSVCGCLGRGGGCSIESPVQRSLRSQGSPWNISEVQVSTADYLRPQGLAWNMAEDGDALIRPRRARQRPRRRTAWVQRSRSCGGSATMSTPAWRKDRSGRPEHDRRACRSHGRRRRQPVRRADGGAPSCRSSAPAHGPSRRSRWTRRRRWSVRVARRSTKTTCRSGRIQAITRPGDAAAAAEIDDGAGHVRERGEKRRAVLDHVGDRCRTEHPETSRGFQRLDELGVVEARIPIRRG